MRKTIIAGNWKMNMLSKDVKQLLGGIVEHVSGNTYPGNLEVVCSPVFPYLNMAAALITDNINHLVKIAAQNCSENGSGAFTGEVSPAMLKDVGCQYVIIGHSERRQYQKESHQLLAAKTKNAVQTGLHVIFCCGELLEQRKENQHFEVVQQQLEESLKDITETDLGKIVIAYEPVWAIGTGETASPAQANEMHQFIRQIIGKNYAEKAADEMTILYGGSMKPGNAKDLLSQKDIDGGLIGGASLKTESFTEIIDIAGSIV